MKSKLVIIGGLILAIASLYAIVQQHRHTQYRARHTAHPLKKRPDLIVMNSTTYSYNKEGLLKSEITAEKTLHYNEGNLTVVIRPRMIAYTEKRIPWHISADEGRSIDGDKIIHLKGHVRLYQPDAPTSPETTITTTELTYYPSQSVATTDEDVTIVRPGAKLFAHGMRVNLKKGMMITKSR